MKRPLAWIALGILIAFIFVGIYAPFFAASYPIAMVYDGNLSFPLFRYLFFPGYYSKNIDLFFNILMFTFPLLLLSLFWKGYKRKLIILVTGSIQFLCFTYLLFYPAKNPHLPIDDAIIDLRNELQHEKLVCCILFPKDFSHRNISTLWELQKESEEADSHGVLKKKREEIEQEKKKISFVLWPLLSHFHWEEDAGGDQRLNQQLSVWDITRINRKDLTAALIFGIRISLVVGGVAVGISLLIGIPFGAIAGYYGGISDLLLSRLLEVWEAIPAFFLLLLTVAIAETKSIALVIFVIGIFGWTGFSRYVRGEFLKYRNFPYVEAAKMLGATDKSLIFNHILPNAIPPVLTLVPFAIMGAITSEAGLSFLGLGEENTPSWGVLMDEGRSAFPAESYLLWPPAFLLTILLISIAILGDALRDKLDPKSL